MTTNNFHLVIKAEDIKVLHVPMYKGLRIETILEFGRKVEKVNKYLPEDRDIPVSYTHLTLPTKA